MILIRFLPMLLLATGAAAAPDIYSVRVDDGLEILEVNFCAGDRPPASLRGTRGAGRFMERPRPSRGAPTVRHDGGDSLTLAGIRPGDCVAWSVRLREAAAKRSARYDRGADEPVVPSGTWLWRPERFAAPPLVRFELPDGLAVSVPWPPLPDGRPGRDFVVGGTPSAWPDLTAFGRFDVQELQLPGARLRLAVLSGHPAPDRTALTRWILANARAVTAVHGRFPVPHAQLLVVPIGRGGEAVPWAQVNRGGGSGVHFFVDQSYGAAAFLEDWTAAHELAHLLLPFVQRSDAWLSEGVASYYQNVSRPRTGLMTADQGWAKLLAGFGRGEAQAGGQTLREASRAMRRSGAFMRVYWSGAALALTADVTLRTESGGRESLDTVLGRLADCCLPSDRSWTAVELLERMDTLGGDGVFMKLYRRWIDDRAFPDYAPALAALGIKRNGPTLAFSSEPGARRLRDAIMSPAGGDPQPADTANLHRSTQEKTASGR